MSLFKRLAHLLLGNYEIYRIFQSPSMHSTPEVVTTGVSIGTLRFGWLNSSRECEESTFKEIRDLASLFGEESLASGIWLNGVLSCVCVFLYGKRYAFLEDFWTLKKKEAMLVQVITANTARGQSLAPKLFQYSLEQLHSRGFQHIFARIWHSHRASIRAFKKAGWQEMAIVLVIHPFGLPRPFRFQFNKLSRRHNGR